MQGGVKYHLSLWYDSTTDSIPVSRTIGEHSTHQANVINNQGQILYRVLILVKHFLHLVMFSLEQIVFFRLGLATNLEKENWIPTSLTRLKNWPRVTSSPWRRGWINTYLIRDFHDHEEKFTSKTRLKKQAPGETQTLVFFCYKKPALRTHLCPVGWDCWIHRLHLSRRVKKNSNEYPRYGINHLMVRLLSWSFEELEVPFHCHYSKVYSDPEW